MEKIYDGIVLDCTDHKENNKLLTILTSEGKIQAICKGVKKAGSKLKNIACPFCFAEFNILENKQNTVIGANVYDSFFDLSLKYENYLCGCVMLDLLKRTIEQPKVLASLLITLIKSLKSLCYEDVSAKSELINFLLTYLKELGYELNLQNCGLCGKKLENHYLNVYDGSILCQNCAEINSVKLSANQLKFINRQPTELTKQEEIQLLKGLGNTIFCLINIKIKIEDLI